MSKVFISYSWDSEEHKRWVRKLSDELNKAGIETILDQKDMVFGDMIPHFMEKSINNSDYVLLILTPKYKEKADQRLGGVGYEENIITAEVNELRNHRKFIPVLVSGTWGKSTPTWAKGKYGVDFSTEAYFKRDFPALVETMKIGTSKSAPQIITPKLVTQGGNGLPKAPSQIIAPPTIIPVKKGGRVIAVGDNDCGQCDVGYWSDIVAVSAGGYHTVGLRRDGTVVDAGRYVTVFDVSSGWSDIVAISAGINHTIGLKRDGTVVAVGANDYGLCNVSRWSDIVAVAACQWHTVGLKRDGTVAAVGDNSDGQCNVSGWSDIVAVAAGRWHTIGLKCDGAVVAVGENSDGQCNVSGWSNIAAVAACCLHTVGLKRDGTVVAVGDNSDGQCNVSGWSDIVAVSAGGCHTVGLKRDGTVVAVGDNEYGQCNVSNWRNIIAIAAGAYHTVGIVGE